MTLKIKPYKQRNKVGCGPTCLRIIFGYFGKKYSEEEIIKELGGTKKFGTYTTDLAVYAFRQGFKVSCFTNNLKLFGPHFGKLSNEKLIRKLQSLLKKTRKNFDRGVLLSTVRLLKSDVNWVFDYPKLKIIRNFLKKRAPVLVSVNWCALRQTRDDITIGHFIVINGFERDKFFYLDPGDGKEHQISADQLIFAISNNVLDSSAYMIAIEEQNGRANINWRK